MLHIFKAHSWSGDLAETVAMVPEWFAQSEIPFTNMLPDNRFWLEKVLAGQKVQAYFLYDGLNSIERNQVEVVTELE